MAVICLHSCEVIAVNIVRKKEEKLILNLQENLKLIKMIVVPFPGQTN